eukprot:351193_1
MSQSKSSTGAPSSTTSSTVSPYPSPSSIRRMFGPNVTMEDFLTPNPSPSRLRRMFGTNTMDDFEDSRQTQSPSNADITSNEDTSNIDVGLSDTVIGDDADDMDADPANPADDADGVNKEQVDVVMDIAIQVNVDVNVKGREINGDKKDKNMDMKVEKFENKVNVNKAVDKKEDD